MIDPEIQKLLVVQSRDQKWQRAQSTLQAIPGERSAVRGELETLEAEREARRKGFRALEVERKHLEVEIDALESSVRRYKQQQLEVKKNEEYTALTHEIERTEGTIAETEETEIALLLRIDEEKAALDTAEQVLNERKGRLERQLGLLDEKETNAQSEIESTENAYRQAREGVDGEYLEAYDRVRKSNRFPYVVEVTDGKCSGCHLRVSGEVTSGIQKPGTVTCCDQCGRIVYLDR